MELDAQMSIFDAALRNCSTRQESGVATINPLSRESASVGPLDKGKSRAANPKHGGRTQMETGPGLRVTGRDESLYSLAFSRSLANAAVIQLHYALAQAPSEDAPDGKMSVLKELNSRNRCFTAARDIARTAREDFNFGNGLSTLGDIDFFIGVCGFIVTMYQLEKKLTLL